MPFATAEIQLEAEFASEFEDHIETVRRTIPPQLTPLIPEFDVTTGPWRAATPRPGETLRWQGTPREWVFIAMGDGPEIGQVVVADFRGRRQRVDTFEDALHLAASWRR